MKKSAGVLIFAAILFLPVCSFGQLITIQIEAIVNSVSDNDNLLEGKIAVSNKIIGTYTYDSDTPDTNPLSFAGLYQHHSLPYGLELSVGGIIFRSDPQNIEFNIGIANNNQGLDNYGFGSTYNLSLVGGILLDPITWQLDDYSSTALSNTALPTTAPVLSDWDYNILSISGGIGGIAPCYEKNFNINASVFSAVLIPEPISIILFGVGLLALRKQK